MKKRGLIRELLEGYACHQRLSAFVDFSITFTIAILFSGIIY